MQQNQTEHIEDGSGPHPAGDHPVRIRGARFIDPSEAVTAFGVVCGVIGALYSGASAV